MTTRTKAGKATAAYAAQFTALVADGWQLRNYGHGWRYFTRLLPGDHGTPPFAGAKLYESCRVSASGKKVETLESQWLG